MSAPTKLEFITLEPAAAAAGNVAFTSKDAGRWLVLSAPFGPGDRPVWASVSTEQVVAPLLNFNIQPNDAIPGALAMNILAIGMRMALEIEEDVDAIRIFFVNTKSKPEAPVLSIGVAVKKAKK